MAETEDAQVRVAPRRALLAGVGVVGTVATLAACGTASSTDTGSATGTGTTSESTSGSTTNTEPSAAASTGGGTAVKGIAKTTDIPVGSGKIISGVVVTQPTAGTFKAFSSTCTHQGCQVNAISDGLIKCPCHGSEFSVTDGSVKAGPAPAPLPTKKVTVTDGQIVVA